MNDLGTLFKTEKEPVKTKEKELSGLSIEDQLTVTRTMMEIGELFHERIKLEKEIEKKLIMVSKLMGLTDEEIAKKLNRKGN